ncbi:ROK family protein [Terrirubrum flagellatum]|uniref:ROK family protein n=1 Tax=Terrirubrum flagellatum TaxID=2895980 RepID=UPI003CC8142F
MSAPKAETANGSRSGGAPIAHGARQLPKVYVEDYSADIRDGEGFFGEKASSGVFRDLIDELRNQWADIEDPIATPTERLSKKTIDQLLQEGEPREAALIHSAVEKFAQNLSSVTSLLMKTRAWQGVKRIAVGGGFRQSRVGELVIGRAEILVRGEYDDVEMAPIRHHPDEAGLLGCAHLAPSWIFRAYDCIVAVDIGGSNFRCGLVELNQEKAADLTKARVWKSDLWRHANEEPDREQAVEKLGDMLRELISEGEKKGKTIAPFIGIGCPGTVLENGALEGGTLNLPGDWASPDFSIVERVAELIPSIDEHETIVTLHNDAVVQGLSELPFMQDVPKWAVLTIGTGLGNASFRNRDADA